MGGIRPWHIVVLVIAFILLFGWKNLPNAARSLGESMRVFKKEVDEMKTDGSDPKVRSEQPRLDEATNSHTTESQAPHLDERDTRP